MNKWKEIKLGDIIDVKHGYAFSGSGITDMPTDNILVTPGNFHIGGGFKSAKFKYFNLGFPNEYVLKEGDLVVTMTDLSKETDTLGYSAKIPKHNGINFLHNQRVGLVQFKSKDVNKDFVYWVLRTREYQGYIVGTASGKSIMHTAPSRIKDYSFLLPPLNQQTSIATLLNSLEDKISILENQNAILEKIAETLYRQWFVEEENDDWIEKELSEIIDVVIDNRGKTPPTVEFKTEYPLIEVNALNSNSCLIDYSVIRKYVSKETFENWFRKHLKVNDIIISTVGTIGVFSINLTNKGCIAQNLVGLRSNNISSYFIYNYFKTNVDNLMNLDIGGVQPSIKVPHLLGMTMKLPPIELINKYDSIVESYFNKITSNQIQIDILTNLRDTLLPKLMSGVAAVEE